MRFSISTGCGYPDAIDYGASLPVDVQAISDKLFQQLLAGRAAGKVIVADARGGPTLQDAGPPGPEVLADYANQKQRALAAGGYTLTIAGQALTFMTDAERRSLLIAKWTRLQAPNPPAAVNWQFPGLGFVSLAASDFAAAAAAVEDFVQATEDALAPILVAIAAGEISTTAAIDTAAWPANHG